MLHSRLSWLDLVDNRVWWMVDFLLTWPCFQLSRLRWIRWWCQISRLPVTWRSIFNFWNLPLKRHSYYLKGDFQKTVMQNGERSFVFLIPAIFELIHLSRRKLNGSSANGFRSLTYGTLYCLTYKWRLHYGAEFSNVFS